MPGFRGGGRSSQQSQSRGRMSSMQFARRGGFTRAPMGVTGFASRSSSIRASAMNRAMGTRAMTRNGTISRRGGSSKVGLNALRSIGAYSRGRFDHLDGSFNIRNPTTKMGMRLSNRQMRRGNRLNEIDRD